MRRLHYLLAYIIIAERFEVKSSKDFSLYNRIRKRAAQKSMRDGENPRLIRLITAVPFLTKIFYFK